MTLLNLMQYYFSPMLVMIIKIIDAFQFAKSVSFRRFSFCFKRVMLLLDSMQCCFAELTFVQHIIIIHHRH